MEYLILADLGKKLLAIMVNIPIRLKAIRLIKVYNKELSKECFIQI